MRPYRFRITLLVSLLAAALAAVWGAPFAAAASAGDPARFSSARPGTARPVLSEISSLVNSEVIHIKELEDFRDRRRWPKPAAADEEKALAAASATLETLHGDHSRLREDLDFLYRDFVSIKVKDDLMKAGAAAGPGRQSKAAGELGASDIAGLSYEISLLEHTISSKKAESQMLSKEMDGLSRRQEAIQNYLVENEGRFGAQATGAVMIVATSYGNSADFLRVAAQNAAYSEFILRTRQLRYLELRLMALGQNASLVRQELSRATEEYESRSAVDKFIKNSSAAGLYKGKPVLSTAELEIAGIGSSRQGPAEAQKNLDESLKKINQIVGEIQREENSADQRGGPSGRLKLLNLKLSFEQELLRHKTALVSENEDFSKFLVKVANYSADVARGEADGIKKLYKYMQEKGSKTANDAIRREIGDYRLLRDEATGLLVFIRSDRKKLSTQIELLRTEYASRNRESAEIMLGAKGDRALERDAEAVREVVGAIVEILKKRLSLLEKQVDNSEKYETLVGERIKNIDGVISQLLSYVNEIEERLEVVTFREAYRAAVALVYSAYFGVEELPGIARAWLSNRANLYSLSVMLANAAWIVLAGFLIYMAFSRFALSRAKASRSWAFFASVLHYFVILGAVRAFVVVSLDRSGAAGRVMSLVAVTIVIYKLLSALIHELLETGAIDSDIYFRFSLFIKFFLFATPLLILTVNLSDSAHLVILAKFLYKAATLLLILGLSRKYRRRILSNFFVNRHSIRLRHYSSPWVDHMAALYNHIFEKYNLLIVIPLVITAFFYFAGYAGTALYIINSSFLTLMLYSVLYLAPRFSVTTFDWIFMDDSSITGLNAYVRFKESATVYLRVFYRFFFLVIFAVFTLRIWGGRVHYVFEALSSDPAQFIYRKAFVIAAIIGGSVLVWHIVERIADDIARGALSQGTPESLKKRGVTIAPLLKSSAQYVIWFFAIYLVLKEVGIDVTPIIAGAGILGLAVGFGSQNLVRDIVSGFFIIFEDQYNVGDYITAEGIEGTVEEISVRITKIRDLSGTLHIIPNGAITKISNYSKDYSVSRLELSVAYESDINGAIKLIDKISAGLCDEWRADIIERTKVLGIIKFGESDVVIRTQTKVTVGKKIDFECEFRKRILEGFRSSGIEIPYKKIVFIEKNS